MRKPMWYKGGCCLLLAVLLAGCGRGPSQRREALGGGGLTPVKVSLLLDEGQTGSSGETAGSAGPKIETFGTFRGRIVVTGDTPALRPLVEGAKLQAAMCPASQIPDESAIVGPNGGLANVFIYLRRLPNVDIPPVPEESVLLDQRACIFVPHALLVRVGQPVKLLNSDPVAHNVMFTASTFSFNNTLSQNQSDTITFQRAERAPIFTSCSFHGWMQAYLMAVDHPWAALTGPDGEFVIENAPAGPLEFVIWHGKLGYIDKGLKINIPADGEVDRTIEVSGAALAGS